MDMSDLIVVFSFSTHQCSAVIQLVLAVELSLLLEEESSRLVSI